MFISGRRRSAQALKTAVVYLLVSVLSVLFDRVYALYGHGVYSASMSLVFLYSLLGGALVFALLWFFSPQTEAARHSRLFYNLYNSGIAALMVGSLLKGVLEIAGTSSPYLLAYRLAGWLLVGIGGLGCVGMLGKQAQDTR